MLFKIIFENFSNKGILKFHVQMTYLETNFIQQDAKLSCCGLFPLFALFLYPALFVSNVIKMLPADGREPTPKFICKNIQRVQ
jgi:hypothetical protein